MMINISWREV